MADGVEYGKEDEAPGGDETATQDSALSALEAAKARLEESKVK